VFRHVLPAHCSVTRAKNRRSVGWNTPKGHSTAFAVAGAGLAWLPWRDRVMPLRGITPYVFRDALPAHSSVIRKKPAIRRVEYPEWAFHDWSIKARHCI
ncbi:MAG TPA: hypothetical protein VF797_20110, partial [Noviherbaspirillum sp.]